MTGNLLFDLAISLGAVALLVVLSVLLGGLRNAEVTLDSAVARARLDEPDFEAEEWLIDREGRAAVAVSGKGEALLAFAVGDRIATRRVLLQSVAAAADGKSLRLAVKDSTVPVFSLAAKDTATAMKWLGHFSGPD
ncbi:MAG: hypothetical protein GC152_04830 [Alphaproteobacteria bacterium]|nr:hypothetical protein [Alphaproteobacteria bacterium]